MRTRDTAVNLGILQPSISMLSPIAIDDAAARLPPRHDERELKFVLPNSRADIARRWLDRVSRRDPDFPAAIVFTIYYDTPGLLSLGEKINSDYLKRKIRVRWYSDVNGRPSGPAFVEAKLRVGNRRSKARVQLPHSAEELAEWKVQDPRFEALPLLLQEHGIHARELWHPVMLIRYRRDRFTEPLSRSRVSLDSDIAGVAVNPAVLAATDSTTVASAVLEVKGECERLPAALAGLLQLGVRKQSFSKFLAVYCHMTRRIF
jgi:hypothetical protein